MYIYMYIYNTYIIYIHIYIYIYIYLYDMYIETIIFNAAVNKNVLGIFRWSFSFYKRIYVGLF